eukprot:UC4_evm1s378
MSRRYFPVIQERKKILMDIEFLNEKQHQDHLYLHQPPLHHMRAGENPSLLSNMQLILLILSYPAMQANASSGYKPDIDGVPLEFICAYRSLAREYGLKLRPDIDESILFDALMLHDICNQTLSVKGTTSNLSPSASKPISLHSSASAVFVSENGNDANPGTRTLPFKTISKGLSASRMLPAPRAVLIEEGTYYEGSTLSLSELDSGLTLAAAPGSEGKVWITGAAPLPDKLEWKKWKVSPGSPGVLTEEQNANNQHGCRNSNSTDPPRLSCNCQIANSVDECKAICSGLGPEKCTSYAWSNSSWSEYSNYNWLNQCCIHTDGVWHPTQQSNHISGQWFGGKTPLNVWSAKIPAGIKVDQLRVNSARSPRARHPNANPETDQWPIGWLPNAKEWLPAKKYDDPILVDVMNPEIAKRNSTTFSSYTGGIGGPCSHFTPPFSYWCSLHPSGGGGFQYYVPSGMIWPDESFPNGTNFSGYEGKAVLQTWRRSHWSNWMFEIDSINEASQTIMFGKGGFQGCRGGPGSDWYIENILGLLDGPNEHYFDEETQTLYFQPNQTQGEPPATDLSFRASSIQTLLSINASASNPAYNITIQGIGFRDAAPTMLEPHGVPSGGDWALERMGALFFEGTDNLKIQGCEFERNDGNVIMLSGYHRSATILENHFRWTGNTAIAAWGRTDEITDKGIYGWDGTSGNFPWKTKVEGNIIRETGVWEKQSSCWFQAKTAETTLTRNLCFNLARAGFNFNDGFGGGDHVYNNLIFNSNRESADHGPIN